MEKIDTLIYLAQMGMRDLEHGSMEALERLRRNVLIAKDQRSGEEIAVLALKEYYVTVGTITNPHSQQELSAESAFASDMQRIEQALAEYIPNYVEHCRDVMRGESSRER